MTDLVLLARNESETIASVIEAILPAAGLSRLLVVSDHSSDGTAELARTYREAVVISGDFEDKGSAMAAGLFHVETPLVAFCDADLIGLTTGHVELLLSAPPPAGQVVGIPESDVSPPWWPSLSGERRLPTEIARAAGLLGASWKAETRINAAVARAGLPWAHYRLQGVTNPYSWHPKSYARVPLAAAAAFPELCRYALRPGGSLAAGNHR